MTSVAEGTGAAALRAGAGDPATADVALEALGAASVATPEVESLRGHPATLAKMEQAAAQHSARRKRGESKNRGLNGTPSYTVLAPRQVALRSYAAYAPSS
jgi:hypothetical protein